MAAQRSSKQKQKTKIQQKKQPRFGDTMMDEVILIIIVVVSFVVLISLLTKKHFFLQLDLKNKRKTRTYKIY